MAWEPVALELPSELSDETVAQLLESLYALATALENHYSGQLRRYYCGGDERQASRGPVEDDPPF